MAGQPVIDDTSSAQDTDTVSVTFNHTPMGADVVAFIGAEAAERGEAIFVSQIGAVFLAIVLAGDGVAVCGAKTNGNSPHVTVHLRAAVGQ